ncbi:ROK family protein [Microbacterium terricola]|uniref:NagC family transcriptional regulator n=1 Tax=Microbacterium terricola TaxID=344163 RepID=A0ABM8DWI0_9MICO|nr:ROK family protein [Microbacterium terricola]UYK39340.1 ROK family protein [Microbacterium terricola]BDV29937.1 NagC family transcriptional regulator [Microbacterium terricola]
MRVGLDVGGTKTDAVAVDAAGDVVARVRLATGYGPDEVVRTVAAAVDELCASGSIPRSAIRSVGIGIPGQVEPGSGLVAHAVNLGVDRLDLRAAAGDRLGVPIGVENDVKAAALGAYTLHGADGAMAYLNVGTGVAAGIVTDGLLLRGARGTAGEVGHISVDPHGPVCRCGQRGCIEAFAGGGAVTERWARPGALPVRDVFDAADAGDPQALRLRAGIALGIASAVRVLVLTADVDAVVLGGGLTALGDRLIDGVRAELATSAEASPFLRSLRLGERVQLLPSGSPAAALGAALIGAAAETEEALTHG